MINYRVQRMAGISLGLVLTGAGNLTGVHVPQVATWRAVDVTAGAAAAKGPLGINALGCLGFAFSQVTFVLDPRRYQWNNENQTLKVMATNTVFELGDYITVGGGFLSHERASGIGTDVEIPKSCDNDLSRLFFV